jgi:hypothetical protein
MPKLQVRNVKGKWVVNRYGRDFELVFPDGFALVSVAIENKVDTSLSVKKKRTKKVKTDVK